MKWIDCNVQLPNKIDKILLFVVYDFEKPKKSSTAIILGTYCYCRGFIESVDRLDNPYYYDYINRVDYNQHISANARVTHWMVLPDHPGN